MPSYKYTTSTGATRWFCSFYCRSYSGQNKKIKKKGFATKREADAWERDYLARRNGTAASMTVQQVASNFLEDLSARRKPKTVANLRYLIINHILPAFGVRPIADITAADVRQWENDLIASGLAPSTIRHIVNWFSSICTFTTRLYGLPANPVRVAGPLHLSSPSAENGNKLHFWTVEQFARFITAGLPPQFVLIFSLLFWTGCRAGEVLALTLQDYDATRKTIQINKTVSPVDSDHIYIQSPKTATSNRTIALPTHICMMLDDWIIRTDMHDAGDMFFLTPYTQTAEIVFRKYTAIAGLPPIKLHDLRHSHASLLVSLGFPPIVIRDRLGHSSIQITLDTYSHLYPSKSDDVRAALDSAR